MGVRSQADASQEERTKHVDDDVPPAVFEPENESLQEPPFVVTDDAFVVTDDAFVTDDEDLMTQYSAWAKAVTIVEDGENTLGELVSVLGSIEALERHYASQLKRLVGKLTLRESELPSIELGLKAFAEDMQNRAYHSMEFADALRSDVIDGQLRSNLLIMEQEVADTKNVISTMVNVRLAAARQEHNEALREVNRLARSAVVSTLRAQKGHVLTSSDFDRLAINALQDGCNFEEAEKVYRNRVQSWDVVRQETVVNLTKSYETLKELEAIRISTIGTTLLKACVHRAAQARATEYNLKKTIDIVQQQQNHPSAREDCWSTSICRSLRPLEWKEMISRAETLVVSVVPSTICMNGGTAMTLRNFIGQSQFDAMVQNAQKIMGVSFAPSRPLTAQKEQPKVLSWDDIRDKLVPKVVGASILIPEQVEILRVHSDLVSDLFRGKTVEYDWESILTDLQHIFYRYSICDALRLAADIRVASMDAFNVIVKLCRAVLDWCDTSDDFWCARMILNLCFKITTVETEDESILLRRAAPSEAAPVTPKSKTVYQHTLNKALYSHSIWNRIQFWEMAFIYSVSLEKQYESFERVAQISLDETEGDKLRAYFRNKNPDWDELDNFPNHMYTFGIAINQIDKVLRDICVRFRLNGAFQSRMSKCIQNLREKDAAVHPES